MVACVGTATVLTVSSAALALAAPQPAAPPPLLDTLARQLHMPAAQLEAAVRKAELTRLDAFIRDRDLPADQVQAVRARIEHAPLRLNAHFGHPGHPILNVAAAYLGLTPPALASELRQGKSLAEIAQQRGKTRAGLRAAILEALRTELNARSDMAPTARAQALEHLQQRVDQILDRHPGTTRRQVGSG